MKSNLQKRSMSLPLVITLILVLITPLAARSEEIPWDPASTIMQEF